MLRPVLVLALLLAAACGDRRSRASKTATPGGDTIAAASAARTPAKADPSDHVTVVFEDDLDRPTRPPPPTPAAAPTAPPRSRADEISRSLARQLAERGGIQWGLGHPIEWSDFQAPPSPSGREGASSETGEISASTCTGTRFEYGVIAAFIPGHSWVLPQVVADPRQSAVALAHERLHFDITEIISRELRQKLATVEKPCDMTEGERDAMGGAAFEEERRVQQRYDDETTHGLDLEAQGRWAAWAVTTLQQLQGFAAPIGGRDN